MNERDKDTSLLDKKRHFLVKTIDENVKTDLSQLQICILRVKRPKSREKNAKMAKGKPAPKFFEVKKKKETEITFGLQ